LYVDDVLSPDSEHNAHADDRETGIPEDTTETVVPPGVAQAHPKERPSITQLIREGQEIICQVTKDPLGTKGARVSAYVSIPGRHVVFMPTMRHIGVSRRITDDAERKRLKAIVESARLSTEGGF